MKSRTVDLKSSLELKKEKAEAFQTYDRDYLQAEGQRVAGTLGQEMAWMLEKQKEVQRALYLFSK